MQKKLYMGSNLKMYKTIGQTVDYLRELTSLTSDISRDLLELFILPSYLTLDRVTQQVDRSLVRLGPQNMCWADEGQFTGEISPVMMEELGLDLVMIGHSERRHVFGETDEEENKKVLAGVQHGFTTLLCIGETGEQKEFGISREVLREQMIVGLSGVKKDQVGQIWIAYEPVWSIGVNGTPATPEYAEEMHAAMRECLVELFGEAGNTIPLLYGGSVNPGNANELIVCPHIDGLFTGRAAWDAKKFNALIRGVLETLGIS